MLTCICRASIWQMADVSQPQPLLPHARSANHILGTSDEPRLLASRWAGVRHRVDRVAGNRQPMRKADKARLGAGERAVWVVNGLQVCTPCGPQAFPEVGWRLTVPILFGSALQLMQVD
jgi:hypothetical protein